MLTVFKNPPKSQWAAIFKRPQLALKDLGSIVNEVFSAIAERGDAAVSEYTYKFDNVLLDDYSVSQKEIEVAIHSLDEDLKAAINLAKNNIEKFHSAQLTAVQKIETTEGIICWREQRPINKVGIYVPGGTAPLFSTVLMLGIPAKLSNCEQIILCSPPDKEGKIHPAILYAAQLIGITQIFKVGGIQAIGALSFGTESIPKVYKIFGPGNQYVTAAKQIAQNHGLAIDMPAGPSEVLVIADETANPAYVASDLLSQAEHGIDSQVVLLATSQKIIDAVNREIKNQVNFLPRLDIAIEALKHGRAIFFDSLSDCFSASDYYAPEHLILALDNAEDYTDKINNAGSVFLGHYSCESLGDYASGTNHTLPTNGYAKNYSGVSIDSFMRQVTFQQVSQTGLKNIGPSVELMAAAEQLQAHKYAVTIRLNDLK